MAVATGQITIVDLNDAAPYIVGTQTGTTASWTGIANFKELKHGQQITYWLPTTSATNVTLNLTLLGGKTTGPINCYYGGTTRLTTHYPAGSAIRLIYQENALINGVAYTGWWADANYDTNTYDRILYPRNIIAGTAIAAGYLIVGHSVEDKFIPLAKNISFSIDKPLLYAGAAIASGASGTSNYLVYPSGVSLALTNYGAPAFDAGTNTQKMIYIKGTLSGKIFTTDATTLFTYAPTDTPGAVYMLLGQLYSATQISLVNNHDVYMFDRGVFKSFAQIAVEAMGKAVTLEADLTTFVNSTYLNDQTAIQTQLDEKIESYFGTSDPSAAWSSTGEKTIHTGDMWYDSTVGNVKLKRWSGTEWIEITDQIALNAYSNAATAQDTADGKRTVFTTTPSGPYQVGDLWLTSLAEGDGDLYKCITAAASGYTAAHWVKATKYNEAKTLTLSATAQTMSFNAFDVLTPSNQTISFTANLQNLTGTATFVATPYNLSGVVQSAITLGGTGNTRSLSSSQLLSTYSKIVISASLEGLSDTVTISKIKDGAQSVVGFLTNESATLAANTDGTVSNFAPAGGTFEVYDGLVRKTNTADVVYSSVSPTGCTATINATTGVYSVSAMSADTATFTMRANYKDNTVIIDKTLSLSKSKQGATGPQGPQGNTGTSAVSGFLTNESHTVAAAADGTGYSLVTAGGNFKVYSGTTDVTAE